MIYIFSPFIYIPFLQTACFLSPESIWISQFAGKGLIYFMEFSERHIEEILYYTPNEELRRRGLPINGRKFRQVNFKAYGIADLVTINRINKTEYTVCVIELKKDKINADTFWQAVRYARAIAFIVKHKRPRYKINIKIILLGSEVDVAGSFCFLSSVFNNIVLATYTYSFEGIKFLQKVSYISEHGF